MNSVDPHANLPWDHDPTVIEVVRNGFRESAHRARVVITDADGAVARQVGMVASPVYARSSAKPLQAVAMLRAGLDLDGELLALAGSSHAGEPFHLDGVRAILAGAGLGVDRLQNTPDYPLDERARVAWIRAGHGPEALAQNCSGKHAAMLRTCVRAGWDTASYRDHGHPLQRGVLEMYREFTGEEPLAPGVDGCGAPLWAVSLTGLARAFGRIAGAADGEPKRLADAYRAHPTYVSGTRREEAAIMAGVPGLVCKGGAEAVFAAGLADGRGLALKVDDGGSRGVIPLAIAGLRAMGVELGDLERFATVPVLGHGEPVGELRVRCQLLG